MAADTQSLQAIAVEQDHLDLAERRRIDLIAHARTQLRSAVTDATDAERHAMLRARVRRLEEASTGLVLGRIDTTGGATHRIGRVGVPAEDDGPPLVLDWRAEAARPFYTATPLAPQGLRRRRHIRTEGTRVVHIDDEDLDGSAAGGGDLDLVGEAALLAALDERRTGTMGTAVSTLQREQDAIVRSPATPALVVQGGPGTGKTVVALHRIAYLLFTSPEIARRGVLLLGPNPRFLAYVRQVLPALGETAVVAATCDTLLTGHDVAREESRELAEIKGRSSWWPALHSYVASLTPAPGPLTLALDGETYVLPARRVAAAIQAGRGAGRPWHDARRLAHDSVRDALLDAAVARVGELLSGVEDGLEDVLGTVDRALARSDDRGARTRGSASDIDGELSEDDVDRLRERIAADDAVGAALDAWWPTVDANSALDRLLHDPILLAEHASGLTSAEVDAVTAEPGGLSSSDVALLDALVGLLGPVRGSDPAVEPAEFLADRALADPSWTYGHVAVDEAQELSPMQWHMVRRRCPTGSITAVGDIDQTEAAHPHLDWDEALGDALGDRWRRADLTICYRTPREVMAVVGPVLAAARSRQVPPRAIRSTGREPVEVTAGGDAVVETVRRSTAELSERYPGGTVGVVTAPAHRSALIAALPGLPVLLAQEAKGLEWDAVVVVDAAAIAAGPRGHNALYVALTRCTQELVTVRVE